MTPARRLCRQHSGRRTAFAAMFLAVACASERSPAAVDASTPPQGFAVLRAESKVTDKLEDLDRYTSKKAWELAFRAVGEIETNGKGMVSASDLKVGDDSEKGFFFPVERCIRQRLRGLSVEGRDSYRLFNDAAAKSLWEKTQKAASSATPSAADEAAVLRQIVDRYFFTSFGDLAANRLGDALFEQGNVGGALTLWESILEDYPDPHVATLKVQVKACMAMAQLNRREAFDTLAATIKGQSAGQKVTIGGEEVDASEFVRSLAGGMAETGIASGAPVGETPMVLTKADEPVWQISVASREMVEQMEQQVSNMGWAVSLHFTGSTSSVAFDDHRLYVNWFGIVYAADIESGKMLWRSAKFSQALQNAQRFPQYGLNPDNFAISTAGGKVFVLAYDMQTMQRSDSPYQLECLDGETGKSLWKGSGLGAVLTVPQVVGGVGYLIAVKDRQDMQCVAIDPATGKSLWSVSLGQPQAAPNIYMGGMLYSTPALMVDKDALYVATNNGALLSVNMRDHRVDWAFKNDTQAISTDRNYYGALPRTVVTPCTLLKDDGLLYIKDSAASGLYAIDPDAPHLLWRRTVSSEQMVVGIQGHTAFLLGKDLSALDMNSRKLVWSTKIPVNTGMLRPIVEPEHIYVPSLRGIYDIAPATGDILHIFRGADHGSPGGRLITAGGKLIYVTDTTVTAYAAETGTGVK